MIQKRRYGRSNRPGLKRSNRLRSYKIACTGCGKEVVIQVPPPGDKKLFCLECFKK